MSCFYLILESDLFVCEIWICSLFYLNMLNARSMQLRARCMHALWTLSARSMHAQWTLRARSVHTPCTLCVRSVHAHCTNMSGKQILRILDIMNQKRPQWHKYCGAFTWHVSNEEINIIVWKIETYLRREFPPLHRILDPGRGISWCKNMRVFWYNYDNSLKHSRSRSCPTSCRNDPVGSDGSHGDGGEHGLRRKNGWISQYIKWLYRTQIIICLHQVTQHSSYFSTNFLLASTSACSLLYILDLILLLSLLLQIN